MSHRLTQLGRIVSRSGLIATLVLLPAAGMVRADQFDSQIARLQQQAKQQQAQANDLHNKANDYQGKVNELQAQGDALRTQIILSTAEYNKTSADIVQAQADLVSQKNVLNESLKTIYQRGTVSSLEMLASSSNFSDYMNRQEYDQNVKDKIQGSLTRIAGLKAELEKKQASLAANLRDQQAQRQQLDANQSQTSQLLVLAQQNAGAADKQVQASNAEISSLRAAQAAMFARITVTNGAGSTGGFVFRGLSFGGACGGGYPSTWCSAPTDSYVDSWGLYSRECVSYAAWAMTNRGANVGNFNGHGNAYEWPGYLSGRYRVDGNPSGNAVVAIVPRSMIGGVGHAMVVENGGQLTSDGYVSVSQYNWWRTANGPSGEYSTMQVKPAGLQFIHFN